MKKIIDKKKLGILLGLSLSIGLMTSSTAFGLTTYTCDDPDVGCTNMDVYGGNDTLSNYDDAIFNTIDYWNPTGTGYIRPFIRLKDGGDGYITDNPNPTKNDGFESGVNGGNLLEESETFVHNWNKLVTLTERMIFTIDGTNYLSFWLDMNEEVGGVKELIDLVDLRLYIGTGNIYNDIFDDVTGDHDDQHLVWGMDEWDDSTVLLNYLYSGGGSGWGDLNVLIPLFGDVSNYLGKSVHLYSAFNRVGDGFEEWQIEIGEIPDEIPEPTTMLLFGTGLAGLAGVIRRKRN